MMRRGEIRLVDLEPVRGAEADKRRPAVIVSNVPAHTLLHGFDLMSALWLLAATIAWFSLACFVFHRGLRRYSSASS